jgi:uncharacterized protein (DUF1697 family)
VSRTVALLRGINLGRSRRVTMAELRELLECLGYADVRTHLQSGNAVLSTGDRPADVAAAIEAGMADRFGLEVGVVVRTGEELAAIVSADPLGDVADDPARRMVIFLPGKPDRAALRALQREDFGDERLEVGRREVYAWCPGGVGRSKLMAALGDAKVTPGGTARNWRTVTTLAEMAGPTPTGS